MAKPMRTMSGEEYARGKEDAEDSSRCPHGIQHTEEGVEWYDPRWELYARVLYDLA